MKKLMKKSLITILGVLHGIFGSYWGLLGIAFTFPDSSPGSKDYEEDRFFIPFGVMMLLISLAVIAFIYYKLRKNKYHVIIFSVAHIIGTVILILYLINR